MLKKIIKKKIIITSCVVFSLLLLALIPNEDSKINYKEKLEYTSGDVLTHNIFLIDTNNFVAMTKVNVESLNKEKVAREILEILIKDGEYESKIPSGFKSIIPSETKINSIVLEKDIIKIDLSKDMFNVKEEYEEKMIESIIFSLTSIEGINKVIIFNDGEILTKLPLSGKIIPSILDRSFGANKIYNITSINDITSLTIYYINEHNEEFYYVPVTNYINDTREKISIIIDELSNSGLYNDNLMSFMNENVELLTSENIDNTMKLEFNDALFSDIVEKNILEEVVYTISLSVFDNYKGIEEVVFVVDNEEILKKRVE